MLSEGKGNLLEADVDALVNTVNTVGIMGKGIALQFKRAYPEMFAEYKQQVANNNVHLGVVNAWSTGQVAGPRFVINFPTKKHWRAKSRIDDIHAGLIDLTKKVRDLGIRSIAIPPLGCGNGGLRWTEVKPLIYDAFRELRDVDVLVFPPGLTPRAAEMPTAASKPRMTAGRAALIALLQKYSETALASPSLIESQKLMYFLQEAGEPLRLKYVKHHYGPYADNLRHVLQLVEGHYLTGFGDGSSRVAAAEPLTVLQGAPSAAVGVLESHPETMRRIDRVVELADGFESAYGLELLASVHWAAHEADTGDADVVTDGVRSWSSRKGRMFTPEHIRIALDALSQHGWLQGTASSADGRISGTA